MPTPLSSIRPLIPLPTDSTQSSDHHDDPFSALVSSTDPSFSPIFPIPIPKSRAQRPQSTGSLPSTGSDFGSFVSVSATDDPLRQFVPDQRASPTPASSPLANAEFFTKFGEEAKERTDQNGRKVLDELLAHEEDPLNWLEIPKDPPNSREGSDNTTRAGSPEIPPNQTDGLLIDIEQDAFEPRRSRHPPRRENATLPIDVGRERTTRRPSLSARRGSASPPRHRSSTSSSQTSTLSRSWMSSLLSSSRPTPALTSPTSSLSTNDGETMEPRAMFAKSRRTTSTLLPSQRHDFASLAGSPARQTSFSTITHGSPFASHAFTPPSGAPGFTGDRNWNKGFEFERDDVENKCVRLLGRKEVTTPVLTVETADTIRPFLPALSRLPPSWSLLYSADQHGISLNTLYSRCDAQSGGSLVVMEDSSGTMFGAWVSEGVHLSKGAYYGTGDSFLWTSASRKASDMKVYKWTGKNDYIALCEPEFISFGGGDGHYGLYLDESLINGTTHPCPTFGNESLARGERRKQLVTFECIGLEVWGVGP